MLKSMKKLLEDNISEEDISRYSGLPIDEIIKYKELGK